MSRKIILFLVIAFFFSLHNFAEASVIINEIKYSPTTKQWIEIYNDTDSDLDITTYKIIDSSVKTGHGIVALDGGSNLIPKHGFGIIAKVPEDFGAVSFPLFKSSLNIKVSLDKVILKNDLEENVSSVDIDGSATLGNSWQLISGAWKMATPTPGIANEAQATSAIGGGSVGGATIVSGNTSEIKTKVVEIPKIKTKIITKTLGFVGMPLAFQATAFGYQGEQLFSGKYFWNFNDGDSKEVLGNNNQKFTHTYFYPGDYVVSLDYYQNYYSETPEASDQITIKIISADVIISRVGDEKDFFIELTNNTDYNADISNWILGSATKSFIIPRNTILQPKKKMIISPKISNFSILDKDTLKLMNLNREVVFDYVVFSTPVVAKQYLTTTPRIVLTKNTINPPLQKIISADNLTATAISSDAVNNELVNDNAKNTSKTIVPFIFVIFIGTSAGAVYFVRRKKAVSIPGDDFDIIDG